MGGERYYATEEEDNSEEYGWRDNTDGTSGDGNVCTNTWRLVAEFLWEKHPDMRIPPV